MPILTIDTGILLSAVSVIVSIILFMYKTITTKNEKSIVYGQSVKQHESTIIDIKKHVDETSKDVYDIKSNILAFSTKLATLIETLGNLVLSNQNVMNKINCHDIDIIALKKDMEYLKRENEDERKQIEYNRDKVEKLLDKRERL